MISISLGDHFCPEYVTAYIDEVRSVVELYKEKTKNSVSLYFLPYLYLPCVDRATHEKIDSINKRFIELNVESKLAPFYLMPYLVKPVSFGCEANVYIEGKPFFVPDSSFRSRKGGSHLRDKILEVFVTDFSYFVKGQFAVSNKSVVEKCKSNFVIVGSLFDSVLQKKQKKTVKLTPETVEKMRNAVEYTKLKAAKRLKRLKKL